MAFAELLDRSRPLFVGSEAKFGTGAAQFERLVAAHSTDLPGNWALRFIPPLDSTWFYAFLLFLRGVICPVFVPLHREIQFF